MSVLQKLLDSYSVENSTQEAACLWDLGDYTVETLLLDQSRVLSLLDVVNGLSTSFESGRLTVDNYATEVDIAFKSGGLILPASVITPSLEAADNTEKKRNVFLKMIDYIVAKLKQFYQWFFYGSKPIEGAKKTLDGDMKEFNDAKADVKKKTAAATTDGKKENSNPKAYLSSLYVSNGVWDFEKYKAVYVKLLDLNHAVQAFNRDNESIDKLDAAYKAIVDYSATVKAKELAEIADVDSLVVNRLELTVNQGMEIEINRYLKNLDKSTREIIKSYETEVERLQKKAASGEDVGEELEKTKSILHVLTTQTKMAPFLSALGTMIKDGTKILKALK